MMGELSMFFSKSAVQPKNIKTVPSKRFVDSQGAPIEWEVRPLTSGEDEVVRKQYMKTVQIPGKRGQFRPDFDMNGYMAGMATKCTVYPNLNDKELQDSYGVMGAEELLKAMLLAGEYQSYVSTVQQACGFLDMNELADEVKN